MKHIKHIIILGLLFATSLHLMAGGEEQKVGARRLSLGNAYTAIGKDHWQLFANPAGMAGLDKAQVSVNLERRYLLPEINYGVFGFTTPFKEKHFAGIGISTYGFGGYRENKITAAYATTLLEKLDIGAKVNYLNTTIQGYGSSNNFTVDFGLRTQVSETFGIGFYGYNISGTSINEEADEVIPSVLHFGVNFKPGDAVTILADISKDLDYKFSISGGLEYEVNDIIVLRSGLQTFPAQFSAGVGIDYNNFLIDVGNAYDFKLGYTPNLSFAYQFGKKKATKKVENE